MCMDKGYYSPRQDVTDKVVEEMFETQNKSLMAYYLRMAYEDDQHTYMNDLYWVLQNRFKDVDLEEVKEHVKEMLAIDDTDEGMFEELLDD